MYSYHIVFAQNVFVFQLLWLKVSVVKYIFLFTVFDKLHKQIYIG